MELLDKKIQELSNDMINDIIDIVRIPSVQGVPKEGKPFGENVDNALKKALEISEKLGFKIRYMNGYIGYAEYGEGEDYVAVVGHLDVVKEGEGWSNSPYDPCVIDGRIFGRGVLDNKGPIIAALYGLKAIKDLNIKLNTKVRIIFGTNEETGMEDIEYYLKEEKSPVIGFTPDCKYPVVYSERGYLSLKISDKLNSNLDLLSILKIEYNDKVYGKIEIMENRNIINKEDNTYYINIKYPYGCSEEFVLSEVEKQIGDKCNIHIMRRFKPVYIDPSSKEIKALQSAYEEVTKLDGTPVTTTGGTYAKVMPNIVAFGPSFEGQRGIAHNPDEYMDIEDIILNAKIYANSIYKLVQL